MISDQRILAVHPEKGVLKTAVGDVLESPVRLAVDATNDELLVAERGEDARVFRWADRNRDGQPQPEEFSFTKNRTRPGNG